MEERDGLMSSESTGSGSSELAMEELRCRKWLHVLALASLAIVIGDSVFAGARYLAMIVEGCFFLFHATHLATFRRTGSICDEGLPVSLVIGVVAALDWYLQVLNIIFGVGALCRRYQRWALAVNFAFLVVKVAATAAVIALRFPVLRYILPTVLIAAIGVAQCAVAVQCYRNPPPSMLAHEAEEAEHIKREAATALRREHNPYAINS